MLWKWKELYDLPSYKNFKWHFTRQKHYVVSVGVSVGLYTKLCQEIGQTVGSEYVYYSTYFLKAFVACN